MNLVQSFCVKVEQKLNKSDDVFASLKEFDCSDAITEIVDFDPTWNEFIRLGGEAQGKINRENGHIQSIQKMVDHVSAGSKGGNSTIASGKGSFGNAEERNKSASKGGSVQGVKNAKSGHLKKIAQEYWAKVKSGEIVRNKNKC